MKLKLWTLIVQAGLILVACSSGESNEVVRDEMEQKSSGMNEEEVHQWVTAVDETRAATEGKLANLSPKELKTQGMRAQIAQKWSKLHVYIENGQVIRIKSYPHDGVSQRTEEFYFDREQLILAVIEDHGESSGGKGKNELDKLYYFKEGKLVLEINNTKEGEYTIRESDGERLLEEAKEYLELYRASLNEN